MGVHAGALMQLRHQKGFKNFFVIIVDNCDIHRVFHLIALKSYCLSHWELSPALSKEIPWRTEIRNTTWVLGWIHADMGTRSTYAPNLQQMSSEHLFEVYSFPANKVLRKKFNPQVILETFFHTGHTWSSLLTSKYAGYHHRVRVHCESSTMQSKINKINR